MDSLKTLITLHDSIGRVNFAFAVHRDMLVAPDKTGLWNYQILLLVHGQVNGQNPLDQPRFTCLKIDIFHSS